MFGELRSIIVVRLFLLKKELPQPYFPWPHFPQDFEEEKTVIIWFHVQAKILPSHSFYSIRGKLQTHTHTNITHTHTHTHAHPRTPHAHSCFLGLGAYSRKYRRNSAGWSRRYRDGQRERENSL